MSTADDELTWGRSTVDTVCPLDCPDTCSLEVAVERGAIVSIGGSRKHAVTDGYICGKVRRFGERVYGDARLTHPLSVRRGRRGDGQFARTTWDEALATIAGRMVEIRGTWGAEAVLPFSYGGVERPADPGHRRWPGCSGSSGRRGSPHGLRRPYEHRQPKPSTARCRA